MTGGLKFYKKFCGVTGKVLKVAAQLSFRSPGGKLVAWKEKTSSISGTIPPILFKLLSRVGKIMGYITKITGIPQIYLYVVRFFYQN